MGHRPFTCHLLLLEFLSGVLCQHFPIVLKDFAIVYYVTMAPYNSKSMFAWARSVGVLSKSTRFVYQVRRWDGVLMLALKRADVDFERNLLCLNLG